MSNRRTLDTVMTIAARFGGKSINLIVFLIVARTLSLADMGVYGVVFSMSYILSTMLDLGVRNSLAFFLGREPEHRDGYVAQAFVMWIAFSLVAPAAMTASLYLSGLPSIDDRVIGASALLLVSMLYLRMMQGELLGVGDLVLFNKSDLASRIMLIAMTTGLLLAGRLDLAGALWSLAFAQTAAALYLFAHQWRSILAGLSQMKGLAWALLSRGFVFMLSVVLMNASKRLGIIVSSHLAGAEAAGIFFALQRVTEIITEVGLAVAVVMFSHSVRAGASKETAEQVAHSTRIALLVFTFIAIGLAITAPVSVPLLLGSKFAEQPHILLFVLILLATLAGSVWAMIYPSLSVMSSPITVFWLFIPGLAANVLLISPLMVRFGLEGAAVALLVANVILSLSFLLVFRRRFAVPMTDFLIVRPADFNLLFNRFRKARRT